MMPNTKPKKTPPKPQPKTEEKIVWIACRATRGCEGQQAVMVFRHKSGGGGHNARYRCTTCNGSFHINT